MNPSSTAYNIPYTISMGNDVEKGRIEDVFHHLIQRHESFRTSFTMVNEELRQVIHQKVEFKVQEFKVGLGEESKVMEEFIQTFDLSKAPL